MFHLHEGLVLHTGEEGGQGPIQLGPLYVAAPVEDLVASRGGRETGGGEAGIQVGL